MAEIYNFTSNTLLSGTSGNDSVYNSSYGSSVTINTGAGYDEVLNRGESVTINTGEGNDYVYNGGSSVTINTGVGNDSVFNWHGSSVIINTGAGNDSIFNSRGNSVTISGGKGNDSIYNNWDFDKDAPDDYDCENVLFKYAEGDGNDIIYGFKKNSTLSIGGGSYSSEKSGSDIIFTVGEGKITLVGAASLSAVNINGTKTSTPSTETNKWTLSGTTATFGTSSKTLVTVCGVKSASGLSVNGKVITVAKSALNSSKVTVSGDYTLALANDVDKTAKTTKSWSYGNSTSTYNQKTTAYYSLASDKKSISFNKASSKTLVTVKGVKSASGLSLSGKTVTVGASSLNKKTVTISDGYTLKIANGVATPQATSANWSYKNNAATYKAASTSAGYSISSDGKSITYSKAKTASTLATISGVKSADGIKIKNKVITVPNSIIGSSKNVTLNNNGNGYQFVTSVSNKTVKGSANKDAITSKGSNLSIIVVTANDTVKIEGNNTTINGGKGNDVISLSSAAKNNVIVYNSGDGSDILYGFDENDTLKIAKGKAATSTSGNDVIFTVGKGKITVKGAADKTFSYSDANGTKTYSTVPTSSEPYTIKGAGITLSSSYSEKEFDVTTVNGGDDIITINASIKSGLDITGNDNANFIIGGKGADMLDGYKGNDTLTGGAGADTIFYSTGDGNDIITDYEEKDTIKIAKGTVSNISSPDGRNVVLKVGKGSITVQNAAKKEIGITYIENGAEQGYINDEKTVIKNGNETSATITANYFKNSFDFVANTSIITLNAAQAMQGMTITGNKINNNINGTTENDYIDAGAGRDTIFGGTGNDTLIGGKGNDILQGDDGKDVFVYESGDGDDVIIDYRANDDMIHIKSGRLADAYVLEGDVILRVGSGKITIKDGKNKSIKIKDSTGETTSEIYKEKSESDASLFLADDDNFNTDNQLSLLVKNNFADYYFDDLNGSAQLAKENNLIAYAKK
ncbi:MAG: hypothetical protein IKT98_07190 [Selenomonadaceae bacterium]|nr:hypothetical protein [Selenomonadaceae bacterium]